MTFSLLAVAISPVSHVVLMGAEIKVIQPNAWRVVAVMADLLAFRDEAVGKLPSHSVCPVGMPSSAFCPGHPKMPIPVTGNITYPLPAAIALRNLAPETSLVGSR
jgi:hypothetical protein